MRVRTARGGKRIKCKQNSNARQYALSTGLQGERNSIRSAERSFCLLLPVADDDVRIYTPGRTNRAGESPDAGRWGAVTIFWQLLLLFFSYYFFQLLDILF